MGTTPRLAARGFPRNEKLIAAVRTKAKEYLVRAAILGEAVATCALIGGILIFVGHQRLRAWTPALLPPLVGLLVAFEAPLNPGVLRRDLGRSLLVVPETGLAHPGLELGGALR